MQVSTCWTSTQPLAQTTDILVDLALTHCQRAGREGRVISRLLKKRDWKGLLAFELEYDEAPDGPRTEEYRHARQALGFFQKLEDLDLGINKTQVALDKFEAAEEACRKSNLFFQSLYRGTGFCLSADNARCLYGARSFIRRVLGKAPKISGLSVAFGPGATVSIKRCDSNATNKLAEDLSCSNELLASGHFHEIMRSCPHWAQAHEETVFTEIDGDALYEVGVYNVSVRPSKIEFVPKNAKTFRSIIKQPTINGFVQTGIGSVLMRKIASAGLDLRNQSHNRDLARRGSLTGALATLDLSSASDTVCYWLVKFLLPDDWFALLAGARCGSAVYKKRSYVLEQFSSMGNGFTFPLESLIFWALTKSAVDSYCGPVRDRTVSIFGDDIICPTETVGVVATFLEYCGFVVNSDKSCTSGSFRESCGVDYLLGSNIRPYYQKNLVSGRTLYTLHNHYVRLGETEMANKVKSYLPRSLRLYGPDGYGDGHLVSNEWPTRTLREIKGRGYGGFFFETLSLCSKKAISLYPGDWVSPLYSIYTRGYLDLLSGAEGLPSSYGNVLVEGSAVEFAKCGRPLWPLPLSETEPEYKKTLVYTFRHPG